MDLQHSKLDTVIEFLIHESAFMVKVEGPSTYQKILFTINIRQICEVFYIEI